jgi:tetratricopeptide (TPR) repeat protein
MRLAFGRWSPFTEAAVLQLRSIFWNVEMLTLRHVLHWLRSLPSGLAFGVALGVGGGVVTALAALDAPAWSRIFAALVVALCYVGNEVAKAREKGRTAARERAENAAVEEQRLRALERCVLWPAPAVQDVEPISQLGVASSALGRNYVSGDQKIAPYVQRDIDREVSARLRSGGMVLLIGAPASGVTRTAYEATLRVAGSPLLLAPITSDGLSEALNDLDALALLEPKTSLVLWLDHVDSFTDLKPELLYRLQRRSPGLRMIATIASARYESWSATRKPLATAFGDPVRLERLPSDAELQRAADVYPEIDFTEGIAATFAATAALLAKKRGGFHGCPWEAPGDECALAQAVVGVAVEWSATDIEHPISLTRLRALTRGRPGGRNVAGDHLREVLNWATAGVLGGQSLLTLSAGRDAERSYYTAPQIAEIHRAERTSLDESVWSAALELAKLRSDSAAVGRMGFRAHVSGYASEAAEAWAEISSVDEPATTWLQEAAAHSDELGDHAAQILPRQKFYELALDAYGHNDLRVARAQSELGATYLSVGEVARGRELLQQALTTQEPLVDTAPLDLVATLTRLSVAWIQLGQPATARELLARLPSISPTRNRFDSDRAALTLSALAHAYHMLGDFADARDALIVALETQEQLYGPQHPVVAVTLAELSNPRNALGEYPQARRELMRALTIQESKLSEDHPDIAITSMNLGNTLVRLGDPGKARLPLERALKIRRLRFGPTDLGVATALLSLGIMWLRLGEPGKARTVMGEALEIQQDQLGEEHPDLSHTLMHLSDACFDLFEFQQSAKLLDRTQRIQEEKLDRDHPDLARTLTRLARAKRKAGEPDANVLPLLVRALKIQRTRFPEGHPLISATRSDILRIDPGALILDDGFIVRGTTNPDND